MKDETVADRARLAALVALRGVGGLLSAARRPGRALLGRRHRVPDRLLIAPQDIRTADPTVAADVYAGYFAFDGKAVQTGGASPFDVAPPSEAWAASLAGFGWLRHLRAADTALARANARALVGDWIAGRARSGAGPRGAVGRRPDVVARRMLSWLSQSPLLLDGADAAFYRAFTRSLARQADALRAALCRGPGARDLRGVGRLTAAIALCEFVLCADGPPRSRRRASRLLASELGLQILPDGGHVSRDPQALLDLLLDLLPLRQAYAARGAPPPPPLLTAIDRMMPMVRCFRHRDGALALFNGMGSTRPDVLATVLAYDDARGVALTDARPSGYQRLDAGLGTLVVDAGGPPPLAFAGAAHAGTLSFEFSHGGQRIVVNCGGVRDARSPARAASRATAAHSTLVLADRSSGRFAARGPLRGLLYAGPGAVRAERAAGPDGATLDLSHDGYARRTGYLHVRLLTLATGGDRLYGEDRLVPAGGRRPAPAAFAIRFHLHPGLRALPVGQGRAALIAGRDGERWLFEAGGLQVLIEDGIAFANPDGPRRAEQIVVRGRAPEVATVAWSLVRQPPAAAGGG